MSVDLTNPIFNDIDAARAHLEALRWPGGAACAHCDAENVKKLEGKSTRPGVYWCNDCEKPFTVTVNSVMERSKIPLTKWVLGFYLMASSKKGVSSHQLHRMLGITYKSAWFLSMRIREAMKMDPESENGPDMGGGYPHALPAPHEGDADLPPDRELPGCPTFAWAFAKIESTVRYLGIEVDDAIEMA